MEYDVCCWLDECQVLSVEICKYCIGCSVTNKQDCADDGESQLAHAFAEEHDAHEREENDQDEQYAKTPWAGTLVTLEVACC